MTNYAKIEHKSAPLSSDFGRSYACAIFRLTEEELAQMVGRYVRGVKKGKLKGWINWHRVAQGGWVKTGPYDFDDRQGCGFIAPNGKCFGHFIQNGNGVIVLGEDPSEKKGKGDGVIMALRAAIRSAREKAAEAQAMADRKDRIAEPTTVWSDDIVEFTVKACMENGKLEEFLAFLETSDPANAAKVRATWDKLKNVSNT